MSMLSRRSYLDRPNHGAGSGDGSWRRQPELQGRVEQPVGQVAGERRPDEHGELAGSSPASSTTPAEPERGLRAGPGPKTRGAGRSRSPWRGRRGVAAPQPQADPLRGDVRRGAAERRDGAPAASSSWRLELAAFADHQPLVGPEPDDGRPTRRRRHPGVRPGGRVTPSTDGDRRRGRATRREAQVRHREVRLDGDAKPSGSVGAAGASRPSSGWVRCELISHRDGLLRDRPAPSR